MFLIDKYSGLDNKLCKAGFEFVKLSVVFVSLMLRKLFFSI